MAVDNDQGLGACNYIFPREISGRGERYLWINIYSFKDILSSVSTVGQISSVVFLELLVPQKIGPRMSLTVILHFTQCQEKAVGKKVREFKAQPGYILQIIKY